jgi:hypothetical protein
MIKYYYHKSNLTVFSIIWHLAGEYNRIQNLLMMVPTISTQNKVPFGVISNCDLGRKKVILDSPALSTAH